MHKVIDRSSAETFAGWFRALADPTRLQIASLLAEERGALSVGAIVARLEVGQSTVSHHLKVLLETGFVKVEHRGTASLYRINADCLKCFPSAADVMTGAMAGCVPQTCEGVCHNCAPHPAPPVPVTFGLEAAEPRPREIVVVLGATAEWEIVLAARRTGADGRVIGVSGDRESIQSPGLPNAAFAVGEVDHIPLRDDSVDVVLANRAISLAAYKESVAAEVARVLRSGGRIGLVDAVSTLGEGDAYAAMLVTAGIRNVELRPAYDGNRGILTLVARGTKTEPRGLTYAVMHATHGAGVLAVHRAIIESGGETFEPEYREWADWDRLHLKDHRFVALHPVTGQVVGLAALSPVYRRLGDVGVAEVAVFVDPAWQAKGVGGELLMVIVAASEAGGIWTLQAETPPDDVACARILEKAGFRLVGIRELLGRSNGRWHDVALYERRSRIDQPAALSAFSSVLSTVESRVSVSGRTR